MKLTRRDFFKGVGAGTALLGLSGMARPAAAKTTARSTAEPMSRSMAREVESVLLARLRADEVLEGHDRARPGD